MKLPRTFASQQNDASIRAFAEQLSRSLSSYQITFGDSTSNTEYHDMDIWKATGTAPGAPNTEFAVPHQLLRVPWGFYIVQVNVAAKFYGTPTLGTAWTAATNAAPGNIYLKCDTASAVFALIII